MKRKTSNIIATIGLLGLMGGYGGNVCCDAIVDGHKKEHETIRLETTVLQLGNQMEDSRHKIKFNDPKVQEDYNLALNEAYETLKPFYEKTLVIPEAREAKEELVRYNAGDTFFHLMSAIGWGFLGISIIARSRKD